MTYHEEILSKYPKGQWVKPTNNGSNDYSVFADLYEFGLVERKIEYSYRGQALAGATVWFKY